MKALLMAIFSPVALLVFHALMVRIMAKVNTRLSNQAVAVLSILLFNLPAFGLAWELSGSDLMTLAYIMITINCFAYFYFHLFNMTETARRIKVLTGIYTAKVTRLDDLGGYYDTEKALELRLRRLEKLSQIRRLENGNYVLNKRLLYSVSFLIPLFRRLLKFDD